MYCPPKSILPKGTLTPNSGNVSSAMSRSQLLQNQAKYCGQSGIVYVTGQTGPTGPAGPCCTKAFYCTNVELTIASDILSHSCSSSYSFSFPYTFQIGSYPTATICMEAGESPTFYGSQLIGSIVSISDTQLVYHFYNCGNVTIPTNAKIVVHLQVMGALP